MKKRSKSRSKMFDEDHTLGLFIVLITALVLLGIIPMIADHSATREAELFEAKVSIQLPGEDLIFFAEKAVTDFQRTKGLMGRTTLEDDEGMLIIYNPPEPVTMWMKDTLLDLDIIFIDSDLKVMKVYEAESGEGKKDNQLELYPSGAPCAYVLEINMGISKHKGIEKGSSVKIEM